jgi:MHS family proline/betaine transporter-like MFS transporter
MATVNGVKAAAATGSSSYAPLGTASVADEGDVAALLEARAATKPAGGGGGGDGTDLRQLLLVTLISSVGTILEWFDFACFGYFASTFSHLFFPAEDKVASLAAAFAVFAGAFVMRPVGGVLFGYIGDKHGRKRAVLLSVFLMAGSTFAMGCLPTYETVGPLAPVLLTLVRCLQGISTGGQLAGAFCFVVEKAGPERGALFGAISLASSVLGTALGSLCAAVLHMPSVMSEEALESWGWRIPFLLGMLVGVAAHLVKDAVEDNDPPAPEEAGEGGTNPFKAAVTTAWREILLIAGCTGIWSAGFYIITTWVPTFAANPDLIDRPLPSAFAINTGLMLFAAVVLFPFFGHVATKYSPEATMQGATIAGVVLCLPAFGLIVQDSEPTLFIGEGLLVIVISAYGAALPSWMVFNTPQRCRYTVIGLGYNLAHATLGGTAPMLSTLILRWTGSPMFIGLYFGVLAGCCGCVLRWHTKRKARLAGSLGVGLADGGAADGGGAAGGGGGGGGGGRRGYAQLDRASTFDDDDDGGGSAPAAAFSPVRMGNFGDEEAEEDTNEPAAANAAADGDDDNDAAAAPAESVGGAGERQSLMAEEESDTEEDLGAGAGDGHKSYMPLRAEQQHEEDERPAAAAAAAAAAEVPVRAPPQPLPRDHGELPPAAKANETEPQEDDDDDDGDTISTAAI